ncbi:MAG: ParM/StbA family protein [Anaeromicrobium sp.]|uniref:ParM/StbA family protein n=1 Tax=Anaeromicrobium sp. TaxID=1929132 RepID=UPI0025F87753|nr:ParM/StbA family protein [Anaeromicrobium sp.]MCT4593209.1 ParM/StbA family protein [Anaeromicrobium sp.]
MNYGADIGRGNVNIVSLNKRIAFESYCGRARSLDFEDDKTNYIMTIDNNGYFVGEKAKLEGLSRGFQKKKIDKLRSLPLLLTGIFLTTDVEEVRTNIVTGTPVSDYKNQRKEIEEFLKGAYKVGMYGSTKSIALENVSVFPEGAGAYFSLVLNDKGEVVNKELATQKVGMIDIGYKTINLVVFENMKFIDKYSFTVNFGMHQVYNMIYKRLSRAEDITPEQAENIKTGPEYDVLANRIDNDVNKFWGNTSFKIFLCGGGAHLLGKYFPQFFVMDNPEYANANGYFKIAQMLYKPKKLVWEMPK